MAVNISNPTPNRSASGLASGQRLYLREEELDSGLELIFGAGVALKAATHETRAKHQLTWAQARALTVISRKTMGVQRLSIVLDVTKQATINISQDLILRGLVVQQTDQRDARRRSLILTPAGEVIARELGSDLRAVLANAYRKAGGDNVAGSDAVLSAITSPSKKSINTAQTKVTIHE
jgi:DNA-binding MarR family transcriptional regulator